jgi:hypothetical protein
MIERFAVRDVESRRQQWDFAAKKTGKKLKLPFDSRAPVG